MALRQRGPAAGWGRQEASRPDRGLIANRQFPLDILMLHSYIVALGGQDDARHSDSGQYLQAVTDRSQFPSRTPRHASSIACWTSTTTMWRPGQGPVVGAFLSHLFGARRLSRLQQPRAERPFQQTRRLTWDTHESSRQASVARKRRTGTTLWLSPIALRSGSSKSVDAVRSASLSNVVSGRRADSGFHYSAEGNFSIQNVDANLAWRDSLHLAHHLRLPVEVVFQWRHKQGASNPGLTGTLAWSPE